MAQNHQIGNFHQIHQICSSPPLLLARRDTELTWQIEFSMPQSFEPTGDHKVLAKCFCWLQRKVHQKTLVECFLINFRGCILIWESNIMGYIKVDKLIRIAFNCFSPVYQLPHWYLGKAIHFVWEPVLRPPTVWLKRSTKTPQSNPSLFHPAAVRWSDWNQKDLSVHHITWAFGL